MPAPNAEIADREIVLERVFDAPRELVWRAFTQVEHLVHWWGPNGYRTTYDHYELRPGGTAKFTMHGPDGKEWPNKFWFLEVEEPSRIVFDHGDFEKPWFRVTVTFEQSGSRTRYRAHMAFPTAEACAAAKARGAIELGKQTYEKLANYLRAMS